ncbi:conjugal transfer protein MobB [soil metagenome]
MVAKVTTGKNIRGILNYNENKVKAGTASLLMAHNFGNDPEKLTFTNKLTRFQKIMKRNQRVKTNVLHISLNFDPSEKILQEKLKQIAATYMAKIGFEDQPFLVYEHKDAAHPHIHIVTTNVQHSGVRIDLHNIGRNQSENARKEIERAFNLIEAEGRGKSQKEELAPIPLEKINYGKSETKRAISNIIREITRSYKYTSLAELNAVLRCFNIVADPGKPGSMMHKKKGLIYSIINERGEKLGVAIKSSSIYGKPTMAFLEKQYSLNKMLRKSHQLNVITRIENVIKFPDKIPKELFINQLEKAGISVQIRENEEGRIYGITFVDHVTKSVFKGSDLGKQFSANALSQKLQLNNPVFAVDYKELKNTSRFLQSPSTPPFHPKKIINPLEISYAPLSGLENAITELLAAKKSSIDFVSPGFSRKKKRKKKRNL